MSATLAALLHQLDPSLEILIVERLDKVAGESTDAWNNAGTGHAGYCELNYTPENADGSVEINRALGINASFELSLQLWAYMVKQNLLPNPKQFINKIPHMSFVWGEKDVQFLRTRHQALSKHHLFEDMQFSEDPATIAQWAPLLFKQRKVDEKVAATKVEYGSDVDFGALTRLLISQLQQSDKFELQLNCAVKNLKKRSDGGWTVSIKQAGARMQHIQANFVFLGAGGGALPLLQKSGIPEAKGYGGFPVSGQWLVCNNPEIVSQHAAKVYGKAAIGAPPMSVPHLDTRIIDGKASLLFGPYAGFTTKFLKEGSYLDLFKSVKTSNLKPIMLTGMGNMDLTRYLISEVFQTQEQRMTALRNFFPDAKKSDWSLAHAGKRVQIIKQCDEKGGKLEFGTEIITSADGSIAALLGASPGASTSVSAMLQVLERCFKEKITKEWRDKLVQMIPSYGQSLQENATLARKIRSHNLKTLRLN